MENQHTTALAKKRSSTLKLIGVTSLIVLVLLGWLIVRFLSSPAQGSVQPVREQKTAPTKTTFDASPVEVQGKYASFIIPHALQRMTDESITPPILESFNYDYLANSRWRLSISVQPASSSTGGFDAGYQTRLAHPEQYAASTLSLNGKTYRVMTDTQASGFAKVAYLSNGNKTVAISLQGAADSDTPDLEQTFTTVLSSWQWK